MSTASDPRDAAIIALREALLESRQNAPAQAEHIDTVLRETEHIAREAESRIHASSIQEEYSLLDWEGLGADIWRNEIAGRDTQEYINEMRNKEWNEHAV